VRYLAKSLGEYEGERVSVAPRASHSSSRARYHKLSDCEEPRGTAEFLSQFTEGTYRHWLTSNDIDKRMEDYRYDMENLTKEVKKATSKKGLAEKTALIVDRLSQLEMVEWALLERGAKTFTELHLDIETYPSPPEYHLIEEKLPSADYKLEFGFTGVKDLTVDRKDAYFEL
jgi:hypothetical protein